LTELIDNSGKTRKLGATQARHSLLQHFMISILIASTILLLTTIEDLFKTKYPKKVIPNIYFLPAILLTFLNPQSLGLSITVLVTGIIANRKLDFGMADTFALTTIALTGYGPDAVIAGLTGLYISDKTVYRTKENFPGLPGITLGFLIYITTQII